MSGAMTQEEWDASNFNNAEVSRQQRMRDQLYEENQRLRAEVDRLKLVLAEFPGRSVGEAEWNRWLYRRDHALERP